MPKHHQIDQKFQREKAQVEHLLQRCGLAPSGSLLNPNTTRDESGADVIAPLQGKRIGVQVGEIECALTISGPEPKLATGRGKPRAAEMKAARSGMYAGWVENNPAKLYAAIAHLVIEKSRKQMARFDERWLLIIVCCPTQGAVLSTFVPTWEITPEGLGLATSNALAASMYDRAFVLPIQGVENALYLWDKPSGHWTKDVVPKCVPDASFVELKALFFNSAYLADPVAWQDLILKEGRAEWPEINIGR